MDLSRITWISDRAFGTVVGTALARIFQCELPDDPDADTLDPVKEELAALALAPVPPTGVLYPDAAIWPGPVAFSVARVGSGATATRLQIADLVVASVERRCAQAVFVTTGRLPAGAEELVRRACQDFGVALILVSREELPGLLCGELPDVARVCPEVSARVTRRAAP